MPVGAKSSQHANHTQQVAASVRRFAALTRSSLKGMSCSNVEQVDDLTQHYYALPKMLPASERIEKAEHLLAAMGATIRHRRAPGIWRRRLSMRLLNGPLNPLREEFGEGADLLVNARAVQRG